MLLLVDRKLWSSSHNLLFIFVFDTGRQMIRGDCPYYTVSLRTLDSAKSKLNTHRDRTARLLKNFRVRLVGRTKAILILRLWRAHRRIRSFFRI